jgi:hypothetical protein
MERSDRIIAGEPTTGVPAHCGVLRTPCAGYKMGRSADVVQWQNASFPSSRRGFDSPHPLKRRVLTERVTTVAIAQLRRLLRSPVSRSSPQRWRPRRGWTVPRSLHDRTKQYPEVGHEQGPPTASTSWAASSFSGIISAPKPRRASMTPGSTGQSDRDPGAGRRHTPAGPPCRSSAPGGSAPRACERGGEAGPAPP